MTRSPSNVGSGGSVSESSMNQTLRTARHGPAGRYQPGLVHGTDLAAVRPEERMVA
jgi:hypothetical protein